MVPASKSTLSHVTSSSADERPAVVMASTTNSRMCGMRQLSISRSTSCSVITRARGAGFFGTHT